MSELSAICPLTFGAMDGPGLKTGQAERTDDGQLIVSVAGVDLSHAGLDQLLGSMDASARRRLLEKGR